ncbi:rRNA N-glycosidase [Rhynchospora pubera]|uniref:rRNA N-glycosidase n=1 Tax=Rhynchospora pubera TaxID=906938 RepID=A0AAV8DQJ9_9POAL|nr:rRNA N-glycosidase [Rhynchospora pubera]KAJ4780147.1 rRNA N-glycosidase [Rhynchospora pubera]
MGRKRDNTGHPFPLPLPFPAPSALRRRGDKDHRSEAVDPHPSWRPPMPVEEGIWKPIRVETNSKGDDLRSGSKLIEVYDVKVHLQGKIPGNIHGNVRLIAQCWRPFLFNRDKEHALLTKDKDSLPLDGPDVVPLGHDPFYIVADLKIDDDELCEGHLRWDPTLRPSNRWLTDEIRGKKGSVRVTYAVMSRAYLAELDVILSESIPLKIHGDIVVYIDNMQYLRYSVFGKKSHDCCTIKPLGRIPLSRSLFCCPYGSSLVVKVDLWNSDTAKPLARGALLFPPEYFGELVGKLGDQINMVQVKVNWLYFLDHPKSRAAFLGISN